MLSTSKFTSGITGFGRLGSCSKGSFNICAADFDDSITSKYVTNIVTHNTRYCVFQLSWIPIIIYGCHGNNLGNNK